MSLSFEKMNLIFDKFIDELKEKFTLPLPGNEVQLRMAPDLRLVTPIDASLQINAKQSSVLILLFPNQEDICTVLMKRQDYEGVHSGQISFPGGKFEKSDITFEKNALREAHEEIGIDISKIKVIGELTSLYIPRSNFLVHPIVAYTKSFPDFNIDKKEVNELIISDLNFFLNKKNIFSKVFYTNNKIPVTAPYYNLKGHHVWGATAMILNEFVEIISATDSFKKR